MKKCGKQKRSKKAKSETADTVTPAKRNRKITACPHVTAPYCVKGKCAACEKQSFISTRLHVQQLAVVVAIIVVQRCGYYKERRAADGSYVDYESSSDNSSRGGEEKGPTATTSTANKAQDSAAEQSDSSKSSEDEPIARFMHTNSTATGPDTTCSTAVSSTAAASTTGAGTVTSAATAATVATAVTAAATATAADDSSSTDSDSNNEEPQPLARMCIHTDQPDFKASMCQQCYETWVITRPDPEPGAITAANNNNSSSASTSKPGKIKRRHSASSRIKTVNYVTFIVVTAPSL
eukprot:5524-Heterococcus_DN1.PRE.2